MSHFEFRLPDVAECDAQGRAGLVGGDGDGFGLPDHRKAGNLRQRRALDRVQARRQ